MNGDDAQSLVNFLRRNGTTPSEEGKTDDVGEVDDGNEQNKREETEEDNEARKLSDTMKECTNSTDEENWKRKQEQSQKANKSNKRKRKREITKDRHHRGRRQEESDKEMKTILNNAEEDLLLVRREDVEQEAGLKDKCITTEKEAEEEQPKPREDEQQIDQTNKGEQVSSEQHEQHDQQQKEIVIREEGQEDEIFLDFSLIEMECKIDETKDMSGEGELGWHASESKETNKAEQQTEQNSSGHPLSTLPSHFRPSSPIKLTDWYLKV